MTGLSQQRYSDDRDRNLSRIARAAPTILTACILLVTAAVSADIRIPFPSPQDPGGPVYTTIERGLPLHDGDAAAVLFYRDPACVPDDFNLLEGQDLAGFPDAPRAFACPLTVNGFAIWKNGPPLDLVPRLVITRGTGAVPVWLASWAELESAMADDVLTIGELRTLSSLRVGSAFHFEERRVLSEVSDPSELVTTVALNGTAQGLLIGADGLRGFEFSYIFGGGALHKVVVQFH
jgi:hypothetical protein